MDELRKYGQVLDFIADDVLPFGFEQFFDVKSRALLDEKIEVLQALKDGKTIAEIPRFYEVLELLPDEGEIWD